ncbi:hypothetical protein SESBI_47911 [Sesbania bispinosa]|nr:hypothetical protein SESBI_47911 [Sesbania bispinosa]
MVLDGLVWVEGENDVVLVVPGDEVGEVRVFNGRKRMQIEGDLAVELIPLHAFV